MNGRLAILAAVCLWPATSKAAPAGAPFRIDRERRLSVELTADSAAGPASIREHAIAWHPVRAKYYLAADVVPLSSPRHPNTYDTEIHLWSSVDLAQWEYHGVAIEKGQPGESYDGYGVASPAGMVFAGGKLYVPFSARRTERFDRRSIGLAWSGANPEELPWRKSSRPISDLEGEDDDPALLTIAGDERLHLYHRRTGPGGYRIVHAASATPEEIDSWPRAEPATPRPEAVRAQELTGAFSEDGKAHLLVIEHLTAGGMRIAHLAGARPEGPFGTADPSERYLTAQSQAANLAYGGHITPVVRDGRLAAFFWTVHQEGKRYGLAGHPARLGPERRPADVRVESLGERIEAVTFSSDVLKREKSFSAVLPEGYDRSRGQWPVMFLFHGRGRHERSLVDDAACRKALLAAPFVVVLPDGDDGWYIDSPVRADDRYQAYVEEVIDVADSWYGLSRRRESRGLSGWSMGGYGSMRLAEVRREEYGAVAPVIGLLDFPRRGLPEGQSYRVPVDRFGVEADVWRRFNPITQADRLRDTSILIVTADRAFDRTMNENFAGRLKELRIRHEWRMLEGKHTFDVVRQALPMVIEFMTRSLEDPQR